MGGQVDIWGDGLQTRSFLCVDECLEGVTRLMRSDFMGSVNIGSDEIISINKFVDMVARVAGKTIRKNNIPGLEGVRGRNSDNRLIQERLGWRPIEKLEDGIRKTYAWISEQVRLSRKQSPGSSHKRRGAGKSECLGKSANVSDFEED